MDCQSCIEDLSAYLDGELDKTRFREIANHLGGCLPCREELESLKRSLCLVESHLKELEPRPEIWNNLTAKIAVSQTVSRSAAMLRFFVPYRWTYAVAALAASVIMAVGVWGIWSHQQSERIVQQYMREYVQRRDVEEQAKRDKSTDTQAGTRTADAVHSEYSGNPFVEVSAEEFDNPFRSEAQ